MFDIGFGEMILLAAIALIAIGPKQLPEVARTIGRLLNELKRASGDFTKTLVDASGDANATISDVRNSLSKVVEPTLQQLNQVVDPLKQSLPQIEPLDLNQMSFHQTLQGTPPHHGDMPQPEALDDKDQMSFDLNSATDTKKES